MALTLVSYAFLILLVIIAVVTFTDISSWGYHEEGTGAIIMWGFIPWYGFWMRVTKRIYK